MMGVSDDRELMRFYDGELSEAEALAVRRRLECDPEACAKLRALAQTGALVQQWAELRSEGFDVADEIMARLGPPSRRRSRLVELWLPAAAAVALAAAVLLVIGGRQSSAPVDRPAAGAQRPVATRAAVLPVREPSVAIESVDFGEKPGTIFMVGEGGQTPVIWLTDPPPTRMPL